MLDVGVDVKERRHQLVVRRAAAQPHRVCMSGLAAVISLSTCEVCASPRLGLSCHCGLTHRLSTFRLSVEPYQTVLQELPQHSGLLY